MNIQKLVTFAFASKRRKLATLTMLGVTGIGALVGSGGDSSPAKAPVVVSTPSADSPQTTAQTAPVGTTCDGVHFNIQVAAGDKRDRDGDGLACEKH